MASVDLPQNFGSRAPLTIQPLEETTLKAAKVFHIRNEGQVDPQTFGLNLQIIKKDVSNLPDSVWESLQHAPSMLRVSGIDEDDLNEDQQEALNVVETYIETRSNPSIRLLYSLQALGNISIHPQLHLKYFQSIIKITQQCLNILTPNQIKNLNDKNRSDTLRGIKLAYANHFSKPEFSQLIKSKFDSMFIGHIGV